MFSPPDEDRPKQTAALCRCLLRSLCRSSTIFALVDRASGFVAKSNSRPDRMNMFCFRLRQRAARSPKRLSDPLGPHRESPWACPCQCNTGLASAPPQLRRVLSGRVSISPSISGAAPSFAFVEIGPRRAMPSTTFAKHDDVTCILHGRCCWLAEPRNYFGLMNLLWHICATLRPNGMNNLQYRPGDRLGLV